MACCVQLTLDPREPSWLDIQREDDGVRPQRAWMRVDMRFPRINQNCAAIGQRALAISHPECRIRAVHLDQDMAMVVRMRDERLIHVEQRESAERALRV